MTSIPFYKYQGAGNDFILIDQRQKNYLDRSSTMEIAQFCDRRFGVGADGLILLEHKEGFHFEMIYFNSDGKESSMCGNGGRCIAAFAAYLGIFDNECNFWAIDGPHEAKIMEGDRVDLKMINVEQVEQGEDYYYLNTGSPHYVTFVENLEDLDVTTAGRAIRYSERFATEGTNVNFIKPTTSGIAIATYERGVEEETLACGTGVTAAAIVYYLSRVEKPEFPINVSAKGGNLGVRFERSANLFHDIWLSGPAKKVFEGNYII